MHPTPLILVDGDDWSCRVDYPATIHQIWRNAYGSDVMENARFLPFGPSSTDASFFRNATLSRATPTEDRPYAIAFMGSISERKPIRVHFHELMSGGMKNELAAIARDAGLGGVVYDMTREGFNATSYTYSSSSWPEQSYFDVLARARLYACVVGDVWSDTNLWDVLEFGVIPVVERRAEYKVARARSRRDVRATRARPPAVA